MMLIETDFFVVLSAIDPIEAVDWQSPVALTIVALALIYVIRQFGTLAKKESPAGCGGCGGCAKNKKSPGVSGGLVQIGAAASKQESRSAGSLKSSGSAES